MARAYIEAATWPHKKLFLVRMKDGQLVRMLKCIECVNGSQDPILS
jgi:hypothetical protein